MKTINIIIPYFGDFPNYFPFFLESCKYNPTINWTIITDNSNEYSYPTNVKVITESFDEIRKKIQNCFGFKISLEAPYKLCDYRPAFATIFPEIVKGYDFWGYGDVDLIYGNLRRYLTDEVLNNDKIFVLGHFSLIRNIAENNLVFTDDYCGEKLYKNVFTSPSSFNFDEQFRDRPNINNLFEIREKSIYKRKHMADIYTKSSDFRLDLGNGNPEIKKNSFFLWNKGELIRYVKTANNIDKEEYMYIHLQKRKMNVAVSNYSSLYKIIPNSFDELEVPASDIDNCFEKIKKKHFNMQYFRIRSKNLATKIKKEIGTF